MNAHTGATAERPAPDRPADEVGLPDRPEVDRLVSDLRQSSADFRTLLERYGEVPPALRHYGLIRWQSGEISGAIETFKAALSLTPGDGALWKDLAGVLDGSGETRLAVGCIRRSMESGAEDAQSWLTLANLSSRAGQENEAEIAFKRAIALEPTLGDAHFGLGLLHFGRRQLDASATSLRAAIANGYANATGFLTLGHLLSLTGEFEACAEAFEAAARFTALDPAARRKHARARAYHALIEGSPALGMETYQELAGADAEDLDAVMRDGFSVLSAYGHRDAAAAVGRFRLAKDPDDVTQRYLLDAVTGQALVRAPADYLERYFDRFAASFDDKLVNVLRYEAPEHLARLVAGIRATFADVLDLGCGTGLAAAHLAPLGGRLVGVDVSGGMLAEAGKRRLYADLVKAEALAFLAAHPGQFELVFAADILIYFGDLKPLFDSVARVVGHRGLFAVSIETAPGGDYTLLPSGRFAHSCAYVERVAAPHFREAARQSIAIRLEAGVPIEGLLLVFERDD